MSTLSTYNKDNDIKNWLNSIDVSTFNDKEETCSSVNESSIMESSSSSQSGDELDLGDCSGREKQISAEGSILPQMTALTFHNVSISNSTNVYLGHIYKINGNLSINVINKEEVEENKTPEKDVHKQKSCRFFKA